MTKTVLDRRAEEAHGKSLGCRDILYRSIKQEGVLSQWHHAAGRAKPWLESRPAVVNISDALKHVRRHVAKGRIQDPRFNIECT